MSKQRAGDAERITLEALDELERLEKAATPGPWSGGSRSGMDHVWFDVYGADDDADEILSAEGTATLSACHPSGHDRLKEDQVRRLSLVQFVAALRNCAPALISAARENLTQRERIAELEAEVARRAETIRELTAGEVSAAEYCCGEVKQQLCAENAALTRKLAEVGRERNELQQRAGLPDARTLAEPGIDCMDPSGHRASVRRGISRSSCVC
jgi:hypothetical protein